ncbi:hypothetical protein [Amycolatopsis kentuckyensis]|uniref:hypothetical protein n=1 Tax=Amycolatopsis kentuckyensis TaxID=218823 RepID=UPI001178B685|nr:hypothetical protein [Amycolatopsis kentuckyensis]
MRKILGSLFAGAVLAVVAPVVASLPSAHAEAGSASAASDDSLPQIVETYDYPGADKIFAERGIRLLKGDSHILFTDCSAAGNLVQVWSRTKTNPFCFRVTANQGYLALDLASVYLIKGDDHLLKATLTVKGAATVYDIAKNDLVPVGEGLDPQNGFTPLVELRSASS